jgi:RNA polymerase sigma-70 factor (ECF subfamily)
MEYSLDAGCRSDPAWLFVSLISRSTSSTVGEIQHCGTARTVLPERVCRSIPHRDRSWRAHAVIKGDPGPMKNQIEENEAALIASARDGNGHAFGELVRRHSNRVYGVSFNLLKSREDAEDNLQNVFCKAYCKIHQFEGNSKFSTWLVRIAINEAFMVLRKRRPEDLLACGEDAAAADDTEGKAGVSDLHADPERQYVAKELALQALNTLPLNLRHTFILQKREGWTCRELAETLNVTVATVKSRILRARVRMRRQLLAVSKTGSMALQN